MVIARFRHGGGGDLNSVHVYTLTVYDGKLIAGGDFTVINGILVNRIAAWNGVSWLSLGSGMNNTVSSLTVYDGKLIAGGYFSTAGGISANHIAAWDGAIWSPLGEGRGKDSDFTNISAFTVYEGILRVC